MKKYFGAFLLFLIGSIGYLCAQDSDNLTVRTVGKDSETRLEKVQNFRMTLGGGYAYRVGKIDKMGDKKLDDFASSLRNGFNIDADFQYFFQESWGIGLNANFIKESKTESGELNIPSVGSVSGYTESNQFIYVGPSFVYRYEKNNFGFYMGAGFGPLFYKNTGKISNLEASLSKTTFGSYFGISGEYRFSQSIGAGLKLAGTAGSVKIKELGDDRQNVSNLMVTAFISFRSK